MREFKLILFAMGLGLGLHAQERTVEPTWLYRDVSARPERQIDMSSESCHYTPIFGEGDAEPKVPKSVARFGELTVAPHGNCQTVEYPRKEELYFVLGGSGIFHYGEQTHS